MAIATKKPTENMTPGPEAKTPSVVEENVEKILFTDTPSPEPKKYTKQQLEIASLAGAQKAYNATLYVMKDRLQPAQMEIIKSLLYPVILDLERLGCKINPTNEYVQWKRANLQ